MGSDLSYVEPNSFNAGAVVAPSGTIYCFMRKDCGVLRIIPPDQRWCKRTSLIQKDFKVDKTGANWWFGGALAQDGKIYYTPGGANHVLRFDPETESMTLLDKDLGEFGSDLKWLTCAVAANGCIYAVPCNATKVLKVDTSESTTTVIGMAEGGSIPYASFAYI